MKDQRVNPRAVPCPAVPPGRTRLTKRIRARRWVKRCGSLMLRMLIRRRCHVLAETVGMFSVNGTKTFRCEDSVPVLLGQVRNKKLIHS